MGNTSIEWTDKSSNPLRAYHVETGKRGWFCVHASPGCLNCYAERRNRWIGNGLHFVAQDFKHVRLEMDAEELRSWQRLKPGTKVFPFDMTDLFQDAVPDALIDEAFAAMGMSPATFQVLTKRAARLRTYVEGWYRRTQEKLLPNVWLGVSAEDQQRADERIPFLLQTPAAVRFVSYEPALGPVDFARWLTVRCDECYRYRGTDLAPLTHHHPRGIDWIIVGGESGPGARPFDIAWARSVRDRCEASGVPLFCKQLGAKPFAKRCRACQRFGRCACVSRDEEAAPLQLRDRKGGSPDEWPIDLRVREFPVAVKERPEA